jgi:hypothetical protein
MELDYEAFSLSMFLRKLPKAVHLALEVFVFQGAIPKLG